jgi:hypothetical protein
MTAREHYLQAELLLREIDQDLPVAQTQQALQIIGIQSQIAQTHALLSMREE